MCKDLLLLFQFFGHESLFFSNVQHLLMFKWNVPQTGHFFISFSLVLLFPPSSERAFFLWRSPSFVGSSACRFFSKSQNLSAELVSSVQLFEDGLDFRNSGEVPQRCSQLGFSLLSMMLMSSSSGNDFHVGGV